MHVSSADHDAAPIRFVAEEKAEDFDEQAFDEEFDEDELDEAPAEDHFDDEPPLADPDAMLPISEEIPGAPAADEEDNDEEEGETTGRFQV